MADSPHPGVERVGEPPDQIAALVLVLHGGRSEGFEPAHRYRLALLRMLPFARSLARDGRPHGVGVWLVRYRVRGWNGSRRDPVRDTERALELAGRLHPGAPVVLVGHSMGARAALHAAGHPAVVAVCALAPWLDGTDPVRQLAGRALLIAHGDRERMTDPARSLAYARAAKAVTDRVCRFEVHGDGHAMLRRRRDWNALVRRFVGMELGYGGPDGEIAGAMRRPLPDGLRVALRSAPTGSTAGRVS